MFGLVLVGSPCRVLREQTLWGLADACAVRFVCVVWVLVGFWLPCSWLRVCVVAGGVWWFVENCIVDASIFVWSSV